MNVQIAALAPPGMKVPATPYLFAGCVAMPLLLPIPGFEVVPPFAMSIALISVPYLVAQLCMDAVTPRRGSAFRLAALVFTLAAAFAWIAGIARFGPDMGATLSFLSWISLVAVSVAAQTLLASRDRVTWMLNAWVAFHAIVSVFAVLYLFSKFGSSIITSNMRAPYQMALRELIPSWPNYFGVAIAVALCVVYGRMLSGERGALLRVQLFMLLLGLFVTFSRASYLACITGILTMTFFAGSRLRAFLMLIAGLTATAVAVVFIPAVNFLVMATFQPGTSQNLGLFERLAFAREALLLWWQNPATGIGFRRFADFADPTLVYADGGLMPSQLGSVHNEYVTTLLKGGWVGAAALVFFLIIAYRVLKRALRNRDLRIRQLGVVGFGISATVLAAGVAQESLRTIAVSGIFWALIGALETLGRHPDVNARERRS